MMQKMVNKGKESCTFLTFPIQNVPNVDKAFLYKEVFQIINVEGMDTLDYYHHVPTNGKKINSC